MSASEYIMAGISAVSSLATPVISKLIDNKPETALDAARSLDDSDPIKRVILRLPIAKELSAVSFMTVAGEKIVPQSIIEFGYGAFTFRKSINRNSNYDLAVCIRYDAVASISIPLYLYDSNKQSDSEESASAQKEPAK